ncbi:hypothetical protein [Actinomadura violacea]|uniref:Uncharacterized protein n=1 Tax=Actinomadura violacea TaxID=2819934 RepID=A0ABS3RHQ4_9ACTN|nr:hypothetical protein [Actinomadura violacea]MBO2456252.1 hypothetical protein [Actinomadura violacea]
MGRPVEFRRFAGIRAAPSRQGERCNGRPVIQIRTLTHRRWVLAALVLAVAVAAVVIGFAVRGSSSGASVEFVLGGGTADTGAGPQRKVAGELQSMTTDKRGDVALFTRDSQGYELWTVDRGGTVKRVRVPALDGSSDQAVQAAAAPDGSLYLALDAAGLWKVTRDGKATKVVETTRMRPLTDRVPLEQFSPLSVNGVAVADDGTVFFSDWQNQRSSLLVHRLRAGQVTRIAGKPLSTTQELPDADPNETGGPALDTYIPVGASASPLAWNDGNLYVHTGRSVLRIATATERIYPVVASRNTASLKRPDAPFKPFGKAINGYVDAPRAGDSSHLASITVDRTTGDLYYGAGDPRPGNTATGLSAKFRWSGDLTRSQRNFFNSLRDAQQTIYQVAENGDLSAVTAGAEALSTARGYLYIAVDTCPSSATKCDTTNDQSAVVRLRTAK